MKKRFSEEQIIGFLREAEAGLWLFGDNDEFVGQTREQDPIVSTEVHLIKLITPRAWMQHCSWRSKADTRCAAASAPVWLPNPVVTSKCSISATCTRGSAAS